MGYHLPKILTTSRTTRSTARLAATAPPSPPSPTPATTPASATLAATPGSGTVTALEVPELRRTRSRTRFADNSTGNVAPMDIDLPTPQPPSPRTSKDKTTPLRTRSSKRRLKADHDDVHTSDQSATEVEGGGVPSKRPAKSLSSKNKKKAKAEPKSKTTKTPTKTKLIESSDAVLEEVDSSAPTVPSPTTPTTPRTPRLARRSTTTGRSRSRSRPRAVLAQEDVPPVPPMPLSPRPRYADADAGDAIRAPLSPIRRYPNLPAPTPALNPSALPPDNAPAPGPHPGPTQVNHGSMGTKRSPPKPLRLTSSSLHNTGETGETGLTPLLQNQMAISSPLPAPTPDIDGSSSGPSPVPAVSEETMAGAYSPMPAEMESGLTPAMYGIEFRDSPADAEEGEGKREEMMRLEGMVSDGSPGSLEAAQSALRGAMVGPVPALVSSGPDMPLPAAAAPVPIEQAITAPTPAHLPAPRNYFAELVAAPGTRIQVTISTFLEVMDWPGFDASAFTVHEPEYHEALALEGAQIGGPLDPAALDVLALGSNGPLGGGAQTALPTAGRLPPVRPAAPPAPLAAPSAPIAVPSAPVNANAGPAQTIPSTPTNLPNGPTTTDPVTNVTTILHEGVRYEITDQDLEEMLLLLPDSTP